MSVDTREKIIRAAQEELIRGRGLLEMQAVAKRAQVSVGLAYHHFGSKSGLIAAVVENFFYLLEDVVFSNPKLKATSWAGRERERIYLYISFHFAHPLSIVIMTRLSRTPEVLDVETAFTNRQLISGASMIQSAQEQGILPSDIEPDLVISMMTGGIRQALSCALTNEQRPDPINITNKVWTYIAGALRVNSPPLPPLKEPLKLPDIDIVVPSREPHNTC